ncbi:aminotransferase class I/II-fold pyridoxal phosphate-dependent enzyme, partial [bacterium]|nr:aminotransferase class I/II-fold pyridoxal phosphate-dependent enzyme [bacterium]
LTHGLSIVGDLFVGRDDVVIIPDKFWGVYRLNFATRKGGEIVTFPLFNRKRGFNAKGLEEVLDRESKKHKKCVVLLNFPNNPTGYTPLKEEADEIVRLIKKQAEKGTKLVTIFDDAYFGLFFEDSIKESLFSRVCDIHENVLAVKVDGATKESYAWGFRTGFITFGGKTDYPEDLYFALEMKTKGFIRSVVSSCNHSSQSILEKAFEDPKYDESVKANYKTLEGRVKRLKQVLGNKKFEEDWDYYPFNSGYFMSFNLHNVEAEKVRVHLLDKYGIGTITAGKHDLRIAFSCVDEENLGELIELIHQGVKDLTN